jgi:stalled ribosome rescue protein Dom34
VAKDEKPDTKSGTAAGTGAKTGGIDLAALIAAAGTQTGDATGPKFTTQDAATYVQSVYQQLLGRNAVGAEKSKAINLFLSQSADTDASARQQAIVDLVEGTEEFTISKENKYMDAIYNRIAEDVRKAQA